ncbi:unnamed protein product [Phytophthora lilii]|uniref:Unnamed protein product n=1 Tax=Phytophthora lilii TaxID=2077276 RepID=A0A9W6XM66_9STRA|nr:unnamed protein product [Phytophthora lilii]
MDIALTVLNGLRQIHELRNAIRRQRRVNRETCQQMMVIYVELSSSEALQANDTVRRNRIMERFAAVVQRFSKYLQKYHDMHRVVRIFKQSSMESKRLEVVEEIEEIMKMLNIATTLTVMNGETSASKRAFGALLSREVRG